MEKIIIEVILGAVAAGLLYYKNRKIRGGILGALFLAELGAIEGGYLVQILFGFVKNSSLTYFLIVWGSVTGSLLILGIHQLFSKEKFVKKAETC